MSLQLVIGLAAGVAVGYVIAKKIDAVPTLVSGGKKLDATNAVLAAYYVGVRDGKTQSPYLGEDPIGYLQKAVA
jgi:hypothetical protein